MEGEELTTLTQVLAVVPDALQAAFAVIAFASAVAALTPTPRDDALWGKAYKVLELFALNFGFAKQLPPNKEDVE